MAGRVHKWMQHLHMQKGALHRELGVPQSKKIPAAKLAAAAKKPGLLGKRARLAEVFRHSDHK